MADVLDRRGLMALDVTGFGADDTLDRRERRRDHDEIRLRRAGEEPDGRLRLPGQLPDDALRPRAPVVRAVARMALLCGLLQYLPHARMCGAVIIIVESDHENASFSVSWQGHARFFAGQNDVWRCYPRRWASAHLPRLPCQPPFILREKLRRTCRPVWGGIGKAADAGLLTQVKDDNAAYGVPGWPASVCALVN